MRFPFRRAKSPLACHQVAERLQIYLDREIDEVTARRVARHLEDCRRCGLELSVYTEIKRSLAGGSESVDPAAVDRLRSFGQTLAERGGEPGSGHAPVS